MLTSNYTHGSAVTWTRPNTNVKWIWEEAGNTDIGLSYVHTILNDVRSDAFDGHCTSVTIDDLSVKWIFYANDLIMDNPFDYLADKFPEEVDYIDNYLKDSGCIPTVEFF